MKILVVCGAGASSTFIAQRLNRALEHEGLAHTAKPGAQSSLLFELELADAVLLGPHLADLAEDVRGLSEPRSVPVGVLPDSIGSDLDGSAALSVLRELISGADDPSARPR
ncbi:MULTISPECIES: PTS sugar transporter subunit IIB [Nesterenkonia]|uniref:PTS sugar transporter subunit IIB n=1 Tax=Nesterenkonia TaxID=57494 RepID=UPI00143CD7C1|nr:MULTISPECIES: PTS sugar transporter [Nesterenkonia]